jgi:hypothetical protein
MREGGPNRHSPLGTSAEKSPQPERAAIRVRTCIEAPDPERHMPFRGHALLFIYEKVYVTYMKRKLLGGLNTVFEMGISCRC